MPAARRTAWRQSPAVAVARSVHWPWRQDARRAASRWSAGAWGFLLLDRRCRSSVVVAGAANVAVMTDAVLGHGVDEWPPALEQVLDKSRRTGACGHRSHASSLQLLARVAGR